MFFILLLLSLAASYYIAGLFKLDDVTIQNYQDKLAYILMHPFRNWFNEKIISLITVIFIPMQNMVLQNGQM